ncbi:hypothetical protein BH93_17820 [Rhodococcoides fascians A25f]|uniref:hypothetical protein n=1 Tax=Rhodococcoides fascians TaxID=1828 RepID=UPI00056C9E8D|nr:hypothetical protein [Rhodococcus fascians]QII06958.1 hypothetical protein BH93_17820 [Rhodococcus fascians A25f]
MTGARTFKAKFSSGQCGRCSRPIVKGMDVKYLDTATGRQLVCGGGQCQAGNTPTKFCTSCGQSLPVAEEAR